METNRDGFSNQSLRTRLKRDTVFFAFWLVLMALAVYEYVGDTLSNPGFVLSVVFGGLVAAGITYWFRRTASGRSTGAVYRNTPLGRRLLVSVVVAAIGCGIVFTVSSVGDISLVAGQTALLGGLFASRFTDTVLLCSR